MPGTSAAAGPGQTKAASCSLPPHAAPPDLVEYSFLLGLVTLTGASLYETAKQGGAIVHTLGVVAPVLGIVIAFVAAVLSIKWMVAYLNTHSLAIFGWYRIVLSAVVVALLVARVV